MKATEFKGTVKSFRMLTPTVFETVVDLDGPITFQAGQFASMIIPGAGPKGRDLRRAYSIASSPEETSLEFCIKLVEGGPGTQYLYRLRPGDQLKAVAPYGDFVYEAKSGRSACFIATGTGIAPFRSIIQSKHYKENSPQNAYCIFGVRHESELLYQEELGNVPGLKFVSTVSQPSPDWKGLKGRVTDYLFSQGPEFPWIETDYYLCGHGGMIQEVKNFLLQKGVEKDAIHQEVYYK